MLTFDDARIWYSEEVASLPRTCRVDELLQTKLALRDDRLALLHIVIWDLAIDEELVRGGKFRRCGHDRFFVMRIKIDYSSHRATD